MSRVMVTGGAGFIGSSLVDELLKESNEVLVMDNFDPFYPKEIKLGNIENHKTNERYNLVEGDIRDRDHVFNIFKAYKPEVVIHLAAKAGVRPSVKNPNEYVDVNINGTINLLDASVQYGVGRFIFGSSSSVYGLNEKVPFSESDPLLKPASPYGATKLAGEALCNSYSNCYGMSIISLRFFTVYGPRQRPDLAIHKFTRRIIENESIELYGDGTSSRDYTFVRDIVDGIQKAINRESVGYEVFNLGNDQPTTLLNLVNLIESIVGKKARIEWKPNQVGDVPRTWADLYESNQKLRYKAGVSLPEGLKIFVDWFKNKTGMPYQ